MQARVNRIKERLAKGEIALGGTAQIGSPEIVELIGHAGYDWVFIDAEHGSFDFETVVSMIRAAEATGVTPVVRVPDHNRSFLMKTLDAGATGIIVPGITTREEAEAVVDAARYGPKGHRGACPIIRAAGHGFQEWPLYVKWSDQNSLVWLIVEGVEGIHNFDKIIEVPGIDAIGIGPFDLSQAMGYQGQVEHPAVVGKIEEMVGKARAKNIELMAVIFSTTPEGMRLETRKWMDRGCRIIAAGCDKFFLVQDFKGAVENLRFHP